MSAAKRKGTAWETAVCALFSGAEGLETTTRVAQTGTSDIGDIHLPGRQAVIEAKAAKSFSLREWCRQARAEADAAESDWSIVAAKSPGQSTGQGFSVRFLDEEARLQSRLRQLEHENEILNAALRRAVSCRHAA